MEINLKENKNIKFESSKLFMDSILEERGISRQIQNDAKDFIDYIQNYISENEIEYNQYGFMEKYDEFESEVNDNPIYISLHEYFFKDSETYKKYKHIINYFYQYNNHSKTVYLTIIAIDKKLLPTTFITKMVHELMHRLQYDKSEKELLHTEKYYNNINGLTKEQDDIVRAIKNIIYLSSHYEQEAYANELYSELIFFKPKSYLDYLNHCNSYIAYKNFEKDLKKIEELKNEEFIKSILIDYGYSVDYFIKQANISLKRFARKIGRAISLYIDDSK